MEIKQSLFDIENKLQNIFNYIEENDGEITEELDEQLAIAREEYIKKGESYASVINMFKGYIAQIKEEQERLNRRKKVFENRITILENALFNAVQKFGPIKTAKFKIGTRKSTTTEIDFERATKFKNSVFNLAREIYENGVIAFGEDCDLQGIVDVVNANIKAEWDELRDGEWIPFTIDDLSVFKININSSSTISDLFTNKDGMLEAVLRNEVRFNIDNDLNKTELKNDLGIRDNITIASIQPNVKLSIK